MSGERPGKAKRLAMKCYTVKGTVSEGIAVKDGAVLLGEEGRGRKLVRVPVPAGAEVVGLQGGPTFEIVWPNGGGHFRGYINQGIDRWDGAAPTEDEAAQIAAQGGTWRVSRPNPVVGTLMSVPAKNQSEGAVLVAFRNCSGFRGGWSLSDRQGIIVVAEGACAQGAAGRMGGGPEYLAVVAAGGSATVNRSGRLYGAPATLRMKNAGGVLTIEDVKAVEEQALEVL